MEIFRVSECIMHTTTKALGRGVRVVCGSGEAKRTSRHGTGKRPAALTSSLLEVLAPGLRIEVCNLE